MDVHVDERGRSRVCVDLERMRWLLSLRCSSSMANPMDGLRRLTPLGRDILRHVSDLDAMIGVALREYSVAPPHVQQVIRGWMLRWMADRDTAAQRLGFNPNTLQLDTLLDALQREVAGGAGGGAAVPRLIHDEQVGYEVFQGFIDADGNQYPGRMLLALNRLIDFDLEADSLAVHAGSQLWDGVNAYPVMREGGYFSVIIYFLHSTPEPLKGYFRAMQRATQQEGAFSLTPLAEAQDVAVAGTLAHMLELYNFPTPNCKVNYFKPSALVDILRGRDPATLPCLWTADGEQVRVTRGTNADGEPGWLYGNIFLPTEDGGKTGLLCLAQLIFAMLFCGRVSVLHGTHQGQGGGVGYRYQKEGIMRWCTYAELRLTFHTLLAKDLYAAYLEQFIAAL